MGMSGVSADDKFVFKVELLEGRGFGASMPPGGAAQALSLSVTFGGDVKSTPFSVGKDTHAWHTTLQWRASRQQLRALSNSGQSGCKVVVNRRGNDKPLGWFLLDTRKAKLNAQYSKAGASAAGMPEAEWFAVIGPRPSDAPSVLVRYSLSEEREADADAEAIIRQMDSALTVKGAAGGGGGGRAVAEKAAVVAATPNAERSQTAAGAPGQGQQGAQPSREPSALAATAAIQQDGQGPAAGASAASPPAAAAVASPAGSAGYSSGFASETGSGTEQPAGGDQEPGEAAATAAAPVAEASAAAPVRAATPASSSSSRQHSHEHGSTAAAQPPAPAHAPPASFPSPAPLPARALHTGRGGVAGSLSPPSPRRDAMLGALARRPDPTQGPFRVFELALELRSFHAALRLPLNLACVYVQAMLPPSMLELATRSGFRLHSHMTPLRTTPPVEVSRGLEVMLPNGHLAVRFVAGVMELAEVLGEDPRVSVEVWHQERFRADTLLGLASVPLAPLLQDCWVDGAAPVLAMEVTPGHGRVPDREEQITVGEVRAVISLQDLGPADMPGGMAQHSTTAAPASAAAPAAAPARMPAWTDERAAEFAGGQAAAAAGPGPGSEARVSWRQQQAARAVDVVAASYPSPAAAPVRAAAAPAAAAVAQAPAAAVVTSPAPPPEYQVAWELESWKRAEEVKWRAELKAREAQRMAALEAEWRRRERARDAEVASMRGEYVALEEKARQMLLVLEERERRLVGAEEALLRRRRDLEREHGARMAEAEAAVRRLQVECEHQLDIERDRNAEALRQRSALEQQLAVSEARYASLDQAFAAFREAQRNSDQAELQRQLAEAGRKLMEARDQAERAEERAARAMRAKAAYKAQVTRLAEQLAALHRATAATAAMPHDRAALRDQGGRGWAAWGAVEDDPLGGDVPTAPELAQARSASRQQRELAELRRQLLVLKAAATAQLSPAASPPRGGGGGSGSAAAAAAPSPLAGPAPSQRDGGGGRAAGGTPPPPPPRPATSPPSASGLHHGSRAPTLSPHQGVRRSSPPPATSAPGGGNDATPGTGARPDSQMEAPEATGRPSPSHIPSTASNPAQTPGGPASGPATAPAGDGSAYGPPPASGYFLSLGGGGGRAVSVPDDASPAVLQEARRLVRRRAELVESGAYKEGDALLAQIDTRVESMLRENRVA